ncbi:MAG: cytochrome b [Caulobacteraceae bacterium]|nr:cytochrome b [Caulobacteraceae bacterium]
MADPKKFSPLQRVLHWLMAICILTMFFVGVGMVSTVTPKYLRLIELHKTVGILLLILVVIRIAARWRYGAPALPANLPVPIKLAAGLSHYVLYGLMIVMPLLGWAMLSAANYPVVVFGGLRLPPIAPQGELLHTVLWDAHHYLAFVFFAVVLAHLSAALMHALIRRDGVFEAMSPLPGPSMRQPGG